MTNLQDIQYILNIRSNVDSAEVLLNNIQRGYTPNSITISLSELQSLGGSIVLSSRKTSYKVKEEYILLLSPNPNFLNLSINTDNDNNNLLTISNGVDTIDESVDVAFSQTPMVYSSIPEYILTIQKNVNGVRDLNYRLIDTNSNIYDIDFELIPSDVQLNQSVISASLRVSLNGLATSAKIMVNSTDQFLIGKSSDIYSFDLGSTIEIDSTDITKYKIVSVTTETNGIVNNYNIGNSSESLKINFVLDSDYNVSITTEEIFVKNIETPIIELVNPNTDRIYNINSKSHYPIALRKITNVDKVELIIENDIITYTELGNGIEFVILIPESYIQKIGIYQLQLIPSFNTAIGEALNVTVPVVDNVWVGIPDIRNITYPYIIEGADFVGTDVDFKISWESVDTDYVRIKKPNGNTYIPAPANGEITLNVKKLIELDGTIVSQNENEINITLELVPYNESGNEVLVGNTETILIRFSKGLLNIPRPTAINRIADGFISQFETQIFEEETSKYLTHLFHLGEGDNKVITTWTGSEDSLILKLYEPLPTSVQPNQQVWISKLQSNPIIETVTISGELGDVCNKLKGPNFSIEPDNGIGYRMYDDIISSGSQTSTDLVNHYMNKIGIDTERLHIEYQSGSTILWNNFVNFGSAEELINNFAYKIELIELYQNRYDELTISDGTESDWTSSIAISLEATKVKNNIDTIIREFSGFENYLYQTVDTNITGWEDSLLVSAIQYDKSNPNYVVNNIPEFIYSDYNNKDFILFLDMMGTHFDNIWMYINVLSNRKLIGEKKNSGILDEYLLSVLKSFGWDGKRAFDSEFLWQYIFDNQNGGLYETSLEDSNNQIWRRILNNLPYLLKHKGTGRAMKAIMACYGVPQSMLSIVEFGGPVDVDNHSNSKFTFEDKSATVVLSTSSNIIVPWKSIPSTSDYPQSIELRFKPQTVGTYTIVSGSNFQFTLENTTGSLGKMIFSVDSDLTQSAEFVISTEDYSTLLINKVSGTEYDIIYKTSNGERIYVTSSITLQSTNDWGTGSTIKIGNGFEGSIDEFRLWSLPLEESKFDNHVLFPDAINGNSYTSSTTDLIFRLDFEYIKDLNVNPNIKNVAINTEYGEMYATASNFYSASTYPHQYESYDRIVTADMPSLGYGYSNKIRFEEQELITDLSYKVRATKKSFDTSPIDSNKLGIFFSPNKELNLDIVKSFGDFNIDNYIGNPTDEYQYEYKDLKTLREYYFERLDRNINEYIQLVRYVNKSLFDVLADLAPARAKVAKGLLIEPHFLERSKVKWEKPVGGKLDNETTIDVIDDLSITTDYSSLNSTLIVNESTDLSGTTPMYDTIINEADNTTLVADNPSYDSNLIATDTERIEGTYPSYEVSIDVGISDVIQTQYDSIDILNAVGMSPDSISNRGFGAFFQNGTSIFKRYDSNGNYTEYRSNLYLVEKTVVKNIRTQTSGWPTIGSSPGDGVVFEDVPTQFKEYAITILPYNAPTPMVGNGITNVTLLQNGYLETHYKFTNNLSEGLKRSFYKGSVQTQSTTPDGLPPVETFATNPNVLRVTNTGRSSGDPILIVD
jgi:hypothetical protein